MNIILAIEGENEKIRVDPFGRLHCRVVGAPGIVELRDGSVGVRVAGYELEAEDPHAAIRTAQQALRSNGGDDPYARWPEGLAYLYLARNDDGALDREMLDRARRCFDALEGRREAGGYVPGDRSIYHSWARLFHVQALICEGRFGDAASQRSRRVG